MSAFCLLVMLSSDIGKNLTVYEKESGYAL